MNLLKLLVLIFLTIKQCESVRNVRALQKEHEKPQAVKWMETFFGHASTFDQISSLVQLIQTITIQYLSGCVPIILYDSDVEKSDGILLERLFKTFPTAYAHGQITSNYTVNVIKILKKTCTMCISYILFVADVMKSKDIIGGQNVNKVIIVARSSQWKVYEFLGSEVARDFVNLLIIAQSESIYSGQEKPYILYTHKMYVDGLGSSTPIVLTSWVKNNFSREGVNLFPQKMIDGFAGHRFIISLAHQPPYVIKRGRDVNDDLQWDGVEVRLVSLLGETFNFTTDFREAKDVSVLGAGDAVAKEVAAKKANLGIGGVYTTSERFSVVDISQAHSQDCATFITLSSTALPRYRAIMGPFHWTVWLSVTIVYLFAIIPLALSDKLTVSHLLKRPEEIENMFWYVFGTFTNCFTFAGEASWSKSEKITTRLLVGFYWLFTIITTACYTGSIIAFVTLPMYPETVDTTRQLLEGRYRIGTLDKGGWQYWFYNSTDKYLNKLIKNIEFLPNVESGLKNVTKAFFWPYAFLGSRDELDYIVRTNFTSQHKRAVLHISKECFVPYGVSLLFTLNSVYKNIINKGMLHAMQSGFIIKFARDVEWDLIRSPTGKLLQANSGGTMKIMVDDRPLTLDDTQGMFLLLGAGFLLGCASLLSECLGGCVNFFKRNVRRLSTSIESNPRSRITPTPREKLHSIQYSINLEGSVKRLIANGANSEQPIPNSLDDYDDEMERVFNLDLLFGETRVDNVKATNEEIIRNVYEFKN